MVCVPTQVNNHDKMTYTTPGEMDSMKSVDCQHSPASIPSAELLQNYGDFGRAGVAARRELPSTDIAVR